MTKFLLKILNIFLKILNFVFISISIWVVFIAIFKPDLIKIFLDWLAKIILTLWNWNYLIAFSSAIIESFPVIWVLVPWMQVMLMVWWFFGKHNLFWVIFVAIIWAIIGNYAGYFLWVRYWDIFFKKYGDYFWIWKTELKILKKQIEKNGPYFIIFGKFHNFTRAFVPFIAWSMWMKKHHFWLFNILWSIIWAITIITLWVVFANYYKIIVDYITFILIWILILVWFYIYLFKRENFMQYWKEKNEEIEEKLEKNKK